MVLLECYTSIPLLFLHNFLPILRCVAFYDFIGVMMEIACGIMHSIRYGIRCGAGETGAGETGAFVMVFVTAHSPCSFGDAPPWPSPIGGPW